MNSTSTLSQDAQRVQTVLQHLGSNAVVVEFEITTHTADDAAKAVGCNVEQIAKTVIFKGKKTGKSIGVITSGCNRVNTKKLQKLVNEQFSGAKPEFVEEKTGFIVGGVPPVGYNLDAKYFDQDLLTHDEIWAAAGTPKALFKISPKELADIAGAAIVDIKDEKKSEK